MTKVKPIYEWVSAYKARTGATNWELAKQLGITRQTSATRLSGATDFPLSEVKKLASTLEISIKELCETSPFDLAKRH